MKRLIALMLLCILLLCTACSPQRSAAVPQLNQMKAICELAVSECYYHTVARQNEEKAETILLFWSKDKTFWLEYAGVVTVGIDASRLGLSVQDSKVTITLPEAGVLDCRVDSASLTKDSYIVAKGSAAVKAEDEVAIVARAQELLRQTVAQDTALLAEAQQRAQLLLENYVRSVGEALGTEYTIEWVILPAEAAS